MALDLTKGFTLSIDADRSIEGWPVINEDSIVLKAEDPHSVAVVEITQATLLDLITELMKLAVTDGVYRDRVIHELADAVVNQNGYSADPDESERQDAVRSAVEVAIKAVLEAGSL